MSMLTGKVTDTTVLPAVSGTVAEYTDTWCWPAPGSWFQRHRRDDRAAVGSAARAPVGEAEHGRLG